MISNISSKYCLEFIFSFIEEKKKLSIIIYNKDLQNRINRNINFYKGVSQNILKIDKNGIGKIYDFRGELMFEGEYSNKKKNGKGKVYSAGRLFFEGEFKDGKRNGYGKQYNPRFSSLKLVYEGEYKDGKMNGKGKEYDRYSNIIFDGYYLKDKRWNGLVKIMYKDKLLFEGEYKNGKIWNGKGYKTNNDEIEYEIIDGNGEYKAYEYNFGFLYFDGNLVNGEINGNGKEYYPNGNLNFNAEYLNGIKNGFGKEYYTNGNLKFEGMYKDDMEWKGKGFDINGELEYEIKNGNGQIKQYSDEGDLEFEGKIIEGQINGYGKEYDKELTFEGFYQNGEKMDMEKNINLEN